MASSAFPWRRFRPNGRACSLHVSRSLRLAGVVNGRFVKRAQVCFCDSYFAFVILIFHLTNTRAELVAAPRRSLVCRGRVRFACRRVRRSSRRFYDCKPKSFKGRASSRLQTKARFQGPGALFHVAVVAYVLVVFGVAAPATVHVSTQRCSHSLSRFGCMRGLSRSPPLCVIARMERLY